MKLRVPIISLLIIIVSGLRCYAQSLDVLIDNANRIKMQYGEFDDRYLGALDTLVKAAFIEEHFETAHKYRSIHSDIIEKMFGPASLEYAEAVWRLGNISSFMGEDYVKGCYERCLDIYNNINATNEFPYCHIIGVLSSYYYNMNDFHSALTYQNEYISKTKRWINNEWKGNSVSVVEYAHAHLFLGAINYQMKDFESAANAIYHCISIIKENNLQAIYDEYTLAHGLLASCYRLMEDASKTVVYQEQYVALLGQVEGDMSDNYLSELSQLRYDYWSIKDLNSIKRCSEEILSLIERRCRSMATPVYKESLYISTITDLISFCRAFMDDDGVIEYSERALDLFNKSDSVKIDTYVDIYDELITSYHRKHEYLKESALFDIYENLLCNLNQNKSDKYGQYLVLKAECFFALGRINESEIVYNEVKSLILSLYGKNSQEYLVAILSDADRAANLGMKENCAHNIQECYSIIENCDAFLDSETKEFVICSIHMVEGKLYSIDNPSLAEEKLVMALEEAKSLDVSAHSILVNLGSLYYKHNRDFQKAISFFQEARTELEKSGDNHSLEYMTVLNNIALCAMELGQHSAAIAVFDILEKELKNNYGTANQIYAVTEQNKALFYQQIQDYDKAIECCKASIECCVQLYGENSAEYASCLQNYGTLLQYKRELSESEIVLKKAIRILDSLENSSVIFAYSNLLSVYLMESNYEEAKIVFDTAREKIHTYKLQDTDMEIALCGAMGHGLSLNLVPESKQFFGRIIDIMESNGTNSGISYLRAVMCHISASFYDNTQSGRMISPLFAEYAKTFSDDIKYLNEDERETFISGPWASQIKNILFSLRDDDSQNTDLYDFLLFNKGLLLETSRGFAKAIDESKDIELISKYERYRVLRRYINGEATGDTPSISIEEASLELSIIEREISLSLRQKYDFNSRCSYNEISNSLNKKEIAIEFVSYLNYLDNEEYYAAMLASSKYDTPIFVLLCSKKDLEPFINLSPDKLYSESIVSENMYKLIWEPLSKYFSGVTSIYFSPAGYLNTISIENLYNGREHISDVYTIHRVSSTREICKDNKTAKPTSAVLYGGLTYDEDDDVMLSASRSIRRGIDNAIVFNVVDIQTRKGWDYLPGTREEVDAIQSILIKSNISSIIYSGWGGNEESFKSLSGRNMSILHIATHGFYLGNEQSKKNAFFIQNPFDNTQSPMKEISPMKRSGLLLSGGNRAWKGEPIPNGIEDGVLTAEEIALLDFSMCDIVVLSACETGLGEVTDEGVYGLQRSFKNAGIQTIIMSLWEVDDQATSLMMRTFYTNIARGMAKHDAFRSAQSKVRGEYKEPRFWAAFIMLD